MSKKDLHTHIHALKNDLKQVNTPDPQTIETLNHLTMHVDDLLSNPGLIDLDQKHVFIKKLKKSAEFFEISHPTIFTGINSIINTLNGMGI